MGKLQGVADAHGLTEKQLVIEALKRAKSVNGAAECLKVRPQTIRNKMKLFKIEFRREIVVEVIDHDA